MENSGDSTATFNKTFRKSLVALVIPIALQNLISAAVNSADIVMLGTIGQSAMSGVSLAGQITFVMMLFYFGLATGAGILTAQYWGKKEITVIRRVLSITCMFSVIVSLVFFTASICFPSALMRIFTSDVELIEYGVKYQQTVAFSYLPMSLSFMYLAVAKSIEKARFCAIVSSSCLILNIALNAVCIFVLFPGMPEKAITGVAASTVIVRLGELVCCVIHSLRVGPIRFSLPKRDNVQKQLLRDYIRYTSPALGNGLAWGGALATTTAFIGHISSDMVAANAIANVVRNLAVVLCMGVSSGGSVLIGKFLGSGDLQSAKKAGIKVLKYALSFGVIAGIVILLVKPLVFSLISINATAHEYLDIMLIVCAVYCIGKSINATIIGGIFPAGGDAKFGFICDIIVMWLIIIPVGYVCAFVLRVHPVMLYIILNFDELIKIPISLIRFRQYKWVRNITRNLE